MKVIVTGILLIVLSGSILLWRRCSEPVPHVVMQGSERVTRCMVWKAQRDKATVWLCGSIHLLRETDYPLPEPYGKAFDEAQTVVMELEPDRTGGEQRRQRIQALGMLPAGDKLENRISAATWRDLGEWCRSSGTDLYGMQPLKPWMAALQIPQKTFQRLGYSVARGMDAHFTARLGSRKAIGLETVEDQLANFDRLDASTQEDMIRQAIAEVETAESRMQELAAAWHEGDALRLGSLMEQSMRKFPAVKKLLLDDRNAAWVPRIEEYLESSEPVMILVGSAHLAGDGSVIDLLRKKGITVSQMEYKTRRVPAAAGK